MNYSALTVNMMLLPEGNLILNVIPESYFFRQNNFYYLIFNIFYGEIDGTGGFFTSDFIYSLGCLISGFIYCL